MDLNLRQTDKLLALNSFNKAKKVIASCENEYHLKGARKYINSFFNSYSKSYLVKNTFRVHKPTAYTVGLYNDLLSLLVKKELELIKDD